MLKYRAIRFAAVVGIVMLVALVLGGALQFRSRHRAPLTPTASVPVVLDSSQGETFTPATATTNATTGQQLLTPAQAEAAANISFPTNAAVQTGYLTFPVGSGTPNEFHANATYSYAFTWHNCAPQFGTLNQNTDAPKCTQWVIVDATTGKVLDITWT